jgi:L-alanine-DL-glutamate epimerase-like enolase superfamily enzyme
MKITDVRIHALKPTKQVVLGRSTFAMQFAVIRVLTDEGIEGDFITKGFEDPDTLGKSLRLIKHDIVGQDPLERQKIFEELSFKWRYAGSLLAIIDVALWDIAGKAAKLPIYRLLGAAKHRILAYASTLSYSTDKEFIDLALDCKRKGYKAIKFHTYQDPRKDVALVRTIREALGEDMVLMWDPINAYDRADALMVGKELDKLAVLWYEDPIPSGDVYGLQELCRKLETDIVMGVDFTSLYQYADYARHHATDVLRTSTEFAGITGAMKVAHLAEGLGMKCEPANYGSMLAQAAHFHVELANNNCRFYEVPVPEGIFDICMRDTARIDGEGYVYAPTKPGLGYEIDWDQVERNTQTTY